MNKRSFIKLLAATTVSPWVACFSGWAETEKLKNWAGNLEYSTDRIYAAASLQQVQDYVRKEKKLKVLGTHHCFNFFSFLT